MPRLDVEAVMALGSRLAKGAMTIGQVQRWAGVSQRTAYRWIDALERGGWQVSRVRAAGSGFAFAATPPAPAAAEPAQKPAPPQPRIRKWL
jgi:hypothetical protein